MPGLIYHHHFGRVVYSAIGEEIRGKISNKALYEFASIGMDAFKFTKFITTERLNKSFAISDRMHTRNSMTFILNLYNECKLNNELFPYLCGTVCHYYLDSLVNPYIIHKSGIYDKSINNSIKYRGLKLKLERAIDCYTLYNYYDGKDSNIYPLVKLLTLKSLPKNIYHEIDVVFLKTYNINNGAKFVNKTIQNQRIFYSLIYDPLGIKNKLFGRIDNGKTIFDYRYLSYYNKSIDTKKFDIYNLKHEKWINPAKEQITSIDSLNELFDYAKEMSKRCIDAMYKGIFLDQQFNVNYFIHDINLYTGLSVTEKNDLKYFNSIFK